MTSDTAATEKSGKLSKKESEDRFTQQLLAEVSSLRAFAASLSGSIQLADDLVQETLLKAWAHADSFHEGTNFRAWLFTILRNTYYSLYRKRGREVNDTDGYFAARLSVPAAQDSSIDLADFRTALAKLPDDQREVLVMVGAAGISYEEAAQICGCAVGTIKSRVNRARVKLAEMLNLTSVEEIGPSPQVLAITEKPL